MMTNIVTACLLLAQTQGKPAPIGDGPAPSALPIAWEHKFDFLDLQRIEVQLPGTSETEIYWYMVYTVTNTSRTSQHFFPIFQIVTEDLRRIDSELGISLLVFNAIREKHRPSHPHLVHPTKAIGPLGVGDDNALESVAIWKQFDLNVNNIKVFVAGLSGEKQFLPNPGHDPDRPSRATVTGPGGRTRTEEVNPRDFVLRKTLGIAYHIPGPPARRPAVKPQRTAIRWIMR